jgi:hypothetical protein
VADEVYVVVSSEVLFLNEPPRRLLQLLRELGLEFEERVVPCG